MKLLILIVIYFQLHIFTNLRLDKSFEQHGKVRCIRNDLLQCLTQAGRNRQLCQGAKDKVKYLDIDRVTSQNKKSFLTEAALFPPNNYKCSVDLAYNADRRFFWSRYAKFDLVIQETSGPLIQYAWYIEATCRIEIVFNVNVQCPSSCGDIFDSNTNTFLSSKFRHL